MKTIFLFFLIIFSLKVKAQVDYKYLYITYSDESIYANECIKIYIYKNKEAIELKPIEQNLYKIDRNEKNILIKNSEIDFKINLKKTTRKEKFINISLTINSIESKGEILKIKEGDMWKIYDNCDHLKLCNTIVIEFSRVISINKKLKTTINPIFSKYIFD